MRDSASDRALAPSVEIDRPDASRWLDFGGLHSLLIGTMALDLSLGAYC